MKKHALVFGSIGGGLIIVYFFAIFLFAGQITTEKMPLLEMLGFLRYLILILAVLMAVRSFYREHQPASYGRSFRMGLFTSLIVALFVGIMEAVYALLNPGYMEAYGKMYIDMLHKQHKSEAEIAQVMAEMKSFAWMSSPVGSGVFYFLETAVLGVLAALIIALFFRKPKAIA